MASKAETRLAIIALAKELGEQPPENLEQIDKLDQLTPILEALQAKKSGNGGPEAPPAAPPAPPAPPSNGEGSTGDATQPVADGAGAPPPPLTAPAEVAEKKVVATTYVVKESKMVTTKRGDIGAFQPVWATDFRGGQADLDHWVANGFVEKTDHFE